MLKYRSLVLYKSIVMSEYTNFVGIDVSKDKLDYYDFISEHSQFKNCVSGFKSLINVLPEDCCVVMEATGSYHNQLARYLFESGIPVSIVNPLSVKRFIQMKLRKSKTDKSDAKLIAQYGREQKPKLWIPSPDYIVMCRMIQTTISQYLKHRTSLKNKLHSLISQGISKGVLVRNLNRNIKNLAKEIKKLEEEAATLIKNYSPELFTNLQSIPGIGKKTALLLISGTNAFSTFENYKQVCSYLGLAPVEHSSGTSINKKSRISKTGDARIRNHLFMCSFTACERNPQCKALYDRIVAKGKSKKLALIAVCNKLLKQSLAIAKSGIPYDPNYRSRLKS